MFHPSKGEYEDSLPDDAAPLPFGTRMRILNVSQNYFIAGGMDVMMFELERVLAAHGHHVIPFAAADPQNRPSPYARYFPAAPRTQGTQAGDLLRTLYSPASRRAIGRVLDEQRIELVHLHSYFKRLTPAILPEIRRRGIPIVQTLHEYRAVCPISTLFRDGKLCGECAGRRYGQAIRHRCASGSLARSTWNAAEMWLSDALGHKRDIARFVAISDYQRRMLVDMGLPADRITMIPNPLPPQAPAATGRERTCILFFGRLEQYKGIGQFVELARRLPQLSFAIVGDGGCAEDVRQQVSTLPNVDYRGPLHGAALMQAIDGAICAVIPSLWPEAFGLTEIEALARGTPVVASAIGGMTETVADGHDGFLVPPGAVDDLAAAVTRLADDPLLAADMGRAGAVKVLEQYAPERYYRRMMRVYADVLPAVVQGDPR